MPGRILRNGTNTTVDLSTAGYVEIDAISAEASEAQALAGTDSGTRMSPRRVAVIAEKYDVRRSGVTADGVTDDSAALAAAAAVIAAAGGGQGRIPEGTIRIDSTVTLPSTRVALIGDSDAGTRIEYHGTGAAFDITADGYVRLENMRIVNSGGNGTHGVIVGKAGAATGWKYELRRIECDGFDTAGFHIANCEQSTFEYLYAHTGAGVGFLVNNSRHTTNSNGLNNRFVECRANGNAGDGWDIDEQSIASFLDCQSLNNNPGNAAGWQFRLRGSSAHCVIRGLDVEDHAGTGTSGLIVSGSNHDIGLFAYNVNKGVELSAASGCYLAPSRFSTVTTRLTIGATCTDITVFDGGNLSTVTNSAPKETMFLGPGWTPHPIRKTADETVNNSDVRQSDNHLFFDVAANETWIGEITLFVVGNATADFKYGIDVPAGCTVQHGIHAIRTTDTVMSAPSYISTDDTPTAAVGADTNGTLMKISYYVANGATAGTVQLNWAQSVATVGDTTVKAGSWMTRQRVS